MIRFCNPGPEHPQVVPLEIYNGQDLSQDPGTDPGSRVLVTSVSHLMARKSLLERDMMTTEESQARKTNYISENVDLTYYLYIKCYICAQNT